MFRYLVLNFTKIGQQMWDVEIHLRPSVNCGFHDADLSVSVAH